jgi:hypothetical protein
MKDRVCGCIKSMQAAGEASSVPLRLHTRTTLAPGGHARSSILRMMRVTILLPTPECNVLACGVSPRPNTVSPTRSHASHPGEAVKLEVLATYHALSDRRTGWAAKVLILLVRLSWCSLHEFMRCAV